MSKERMRGSNFLDIFLVAVVLYACKYVGRTSEFFECDCNCIDGETVNIKADQTRHPDSGSSSWMLKYFEKS